MAEQARMVRTRRGDVLIEGIQPVRTVYISGPMRGRPDFNYPQFHEVAGELRHFGLPGFLPEDPPLAVLNPAENFDGDRDRPIHEYLALDIRQVLDADAVVLLPGWRQSEGARLEVAVAQATGKRFFLARPLSDHWGFEPYDPEPQATFEDLRAVAQMDLLRTASDAGVRAVIGEPYPAEPDQLGYVTKDSGVRQEYDSGMVRDTQEGKPMFALLLPVGVPFDEQFLTRCAALMTRGMAKYGLRNWEKANSKEELERFKESGLRHHMQHLAGETDEDHAAAVFFNLLAQITVEYKLRGQAEVDDALDKLRARLAGTGSTIETVPLSELPPWERDLLMSKGAA